MREELGPGVAIDGSVRSRMELGLGVGLGHVRVHSDAQGATLAHGLGAPAFTVGEHIAFGAGEYAPGTLRGDAILAHELAHAAQQRGAVAEDRGSDRAVETDATRATVGALGRIWSGLSELGGGLQGVGGGFGLRISRCDPTPLAVEEVSVPQLSAIDDEFLDELEGSETAELEYEDYKGLQALSASEAAFSGMMGGGAPPMGKFSAASRSVEALKRFRAEQTGAGESADPEAWRARKDRFEGIFENAAVAEAYGELARHEKLAQGELDRYGDPKGLAEVRDALKPYQATLQKVQTEREAGEPISDDMGNVYDPPHAEKHRAAAKSLGAPVRAALGARFPILLAEELDIDRVLLEPDADARLALQWVARAHIQRIRRTRGAIAEKPSRVWKFDRAVTLARSRLGIVDGSVYDLMIQDRNSRVAADEMFRNLLIGALALGLGVLSGGTGTVAVLAAAAGAGISVGTAAVHLQEFVVAEAATGTAFDKAEAISSDEPSLFWLAFDLVTAVLDVGMAARAFTTLKPAAKAVKTVEDAEKLRAPAKAAAQAANAPNPDAVADAVVAGAKQQVAATETIKAVSAADPALVAVVKAAVKDEQAVAGILKLGSKTVSSVLAAFKGSALTRLGRLINEFPQIATSVERLAAALPADKFRAALGKYLFTRSTKAPLLLRAAADAGLTAKDFELVADALKTTNSARSIARQIGGLLIERIAARLPAGEQGIAAFKKIAPGLHPNQSGQIFERWAARNIYNQAGGAERFTASTADLTKQYAAAAPKFKGARVTTDNIVRDAARPNQAGIVDLKSHLLKRNIGTDAEAMKQADNYKEMLRVGVKTPKGERFTWVEYLFANRDSAEASFKALSDKLGDAVKVYFLDDKGVKTLFVAAAP